MTGDDGMSRHEIVTADIGGTHARFALATVEAGKVIAVGAETVLRAADHAGLPDAWAAFAGIMGGKLPRAAALAVAAPITPGVLKFTNSHWLIDPADVAVAIAVDRLTIVNDFAAVAHAVAATADDQLRHLCGPAGVIPSIGNISIVGPGTGLGIAQLLRTRAGYHVIATEGAHIGFAPQDDFEDRLVQRLRARFGRVSVERLVSGPGLREFLVDATPWPDDKALWTAAIAGSDADAAFALGRFAMALGSFAGDCALLHYPVGVVIAGGLGLRLADYLPHSGFGARFVDKGRCRGFMDSLPVRLLTDPQPGLFGAAAAFALEHHE